MIRVLLSAGLRVKHICVLIGFPDEILKSVAWYFYLSVSNKLSLSQTDHTSPVHSWFIEDKSS